MSLFMLARHPTRAIRMSMLGLLLALGRNAFAHASHTHDADNAAAAQHAAFCGYCSTFSAAVDAPDTALAIVLAPPLPLVVPQISSVSVVRRTPSSASPRGPPHA